jgi:hypothetical protein
MIKYNIVTCCYDKILANVAAYVIPGYVCVRCGVNRDFFTFTKILS